MVSKDWIQVQQQGGVLVPDLLKVPYSTDRTYTSASRKVKTTQKSTTVYPKVGRTHKRAGTASVRKNSRRRPTWTSALIHCTELCTDRNRHIDKIDEKKAQGEDILLRRSY